MSTETKSNPNRRGEDNSRLDFLHGFNLTGHSAVNAEAARSRTPRTLSEILHGGLTKTAEGLNFVKIGRTVPAMGEDFSPAEIALADALVAIMAASKMGKLRIAECACAKLAVNNAGKEKWNGEDLSRTRRRTQ